MAYGNGQMMGNSINAALGQQDFSGYERAGQAWAQGISSAGNQIGNAIKLYGEEKKTQTQAEQMAKSMGKIPEFKEMSDAFLQEMANPDLSHRDRTAMAAGIQDSLKLAVLGQGFKNDNRDFDFRERTQANNDAFRNKEFDLKASQIEASMQGDAMMTMSPDEYDAYTESGYDGTVVGRNSDGSLVVKELKRKGVGDGGFTPYMSENGMGFQKNPPMKYAPTPGAGGIQNALPQGQGGQFPDGVPMGDITPIQGVDVDGNAGVLPPRQGVAQQIQQAQQLVPSVPVPKGDVFKVEDGEIGVTRLEGSTPEIKYKIDEQTLAKAEADTAAAAIKVEEANSASEKAAVNKQNDARFFLTKGNEAKKIIKESLGAGVSGASLDVMKSKVFGTQEYILEEQFLKPLRNGVALGNLQKMREESVTGASGLGALNEKEGERLETKGGNLKIGGDKNVLMGDITNLQKDMLDTVHGSKEQRAKWIKEGKITQADNDEVEAIYADYGFGVPKSTSPLQVPSHIQDIINKYK